MHNVFNVQIIIAGYQYLHGRKEREIDIYRSTLKFYFSIVRIKPGKKQPHFPKYPNKTPLVCLLLRLFFPCAPAIILLP